MKNPVTLLVLALLVAGALAIYLLNREPAPKAPAPIAGPPTEALEPSPTPEQTGAAAPAPGDTAEGRQAALEDPEPSPAPTLEDAPLPRGYPRSQIPHRVAKAWGRNEDGSPKGAIGMTIVVDPATSDVQLNELAQDVLEANCDARMLSVRIYDTEDALDSERHKTHDPMIAEHTIGQIWVNPTENRYRPKVRIKVRGEDTLLGADAIPSGEACKAGA